MSYVKNIAVIKGIKDGFSADGGKLSGLVKAEKYSSFLKIEVTFLNFAPLSQGRYVCAVSDGSRTLIVEDGLFEGDSELDTSNGFGALICYINNGVFPVASAICGNYHYTAVGLKGEVERLENGNPREKVKYEDEAIAEENYFEYEINEGGGAVREDKKEEKSGAEIRTDEEASGAFKKEENGLKEKLPPEYGANNGLAGGIFYEKMKSEIEAVFEKFPREAGLERLIEGSRWVKIDYGEGKYYVFGVIYSGVTPNIFATACLRSKSATPPESMKELASFIPLNEYETQRGYWVEYQDARTGAAVRVTLS